MYHSYFMFTNLAILVPHLATYVPSSMEVISTNQPLSMHRSTPAELGRLLRWGKPFFFQGIDFSILASFWTLNIDNIDLRMLQHG